MRHLRGIGDQVLGRGKDTDGPKGVGLRRGKRLGLLAGTATGLLVCTMLFVIAGALGFGFMLGFDLAGRAIDMMGG